jgi:hypothetical protein
MPAKKKTAAKKIGKKTGKKPAVKAAKSVKPKKKVAAKRAAKKTVAVQTVTSSGVVTVKPVEDPGVATEGDAVSVKPSLDKETGVITMVPQE